MCCSSAIRAILGYMIPPFSWPGGKRALVRRLLPLIPDHRNYVEVFAGSAKLLFARTPSRLEILNDLNGELINFFRVAKHRSAEMADALERDCIHAGRFRQLVIAPDSRDEIDRAVRFAYLAWYSFGGKGKHFARASATNPEIKKPLDEIRALLDKVAARLQRVLMEQRDFGDILDRYDHKDTFFYLDPPYIEYQPNGRYEPLSRERRAQMFARLSRTKAHWLMSFEDHAEARTAAKRYGFRLRKVSVVYTLGGRAERKLGREVLMANYPLAA
jgi:DNA adenine methylase